MKRREFLAAAVTAAFAPQLLAQKQGPLVEVWRAPNCGCCGAWVRHLEKNGFTVKVNIVQDAAPVRRAAGIPDELGSCHTAKVNGYVIEGHVPASDIQRLLAEKPKAIGLTAPGMPAGAPGMDVPNSPPYEVLLVKGDGSTTLYKRHA
jgi:hypothetical protein